MNRYLIALAAGVLAVPVPARLLAAEFIPLGDLPTGNFNSAAARVSADGKVVVGTGWITTGIETFRWTREGSMTSLGDLPGGFVQSSPTAISADGSVIAGVGNTAAGPQAYLWTAATGMVGIGELAGGTYQSTVTSMTADGSVIYGSSESFNGPEATRWTQSGGIVSLGNFFGPDFPFLGALGSADGSTIAGGISLPGSYAPYIRSSFLWNATDGAIDLNAAARTTRSIHAIVDLSADGSVAVGQGNIDGKLEAVRWTKAGGVEALGESFGGYASGISADGRVIIGATHGGGLSFIWTETTGIKELRSLFTEAGIDLSTWDNLSVSDVSADGRTFVGGGRHRDGSFEAWMAVLDIVPEPSTFALCMMGFVALLVRRRRGG
jgi:probable HAF family extracellular repeat protein